MQDTLIDQGISLMLYGMGTVFVFLTILVFATSLMSKLVHTFGPAEQSSKKPNIDNPVSPDPATHGAQPKPQLLDAIKKAIAAHRQR